MSTRPTLSERFAASEYRRERLRELMAEYELSAPEIAAMVDRHPTTVRSWLNGYCPMTDHTLALIELILRMGVAA